MGLPTICRLSSECIWCDVLPGVCRYYRLVQAVGCFLLHNISIFVHRRLCDFRAKYYGDQNGYSHHKEA